MRSRSTAIFLAALLLTPLLARADWPAKVFAPYMYIGADDNFKLTDCDDACGQKYFTLAFFIARQEHNAYLKEPSWDGHILINKNLYADQITAIRQRGGDCIASFGGEGGKELAIVETDPTALEAEYQSVIDQYKFTWLDFDIEGNNLDKEPEATARRNSVLASLQKKNPGLIISYTLPVDPDGISDSSQALLKDAVAKGVAVRSANLMVMFFGKRFIGKGKSEGQLGIDSAVKAYEQIKKIEPKIRIGLCPCLGENGSPAEVFTTDDAKTLKDFADKTPWICSLHYWSINADGKPTAERWAFANIFKSFTAK
jgi:hypothetical protein